MVASQSSRQRNRKRDGWPFACGFAAITKGPFMGDVLIRSTAILAVACYAGRVMVAAAGLRDERWQRRVRILWTMGASALAAHTICAFHFQHHWSHAAAWEHTRQRTLELTGWNSGGGLSANYATLAIWLLDVFGWQTALDWPRRHRGWFWFVQIALAFMMLNATAVFGPKYWLPAAAVYGVAVAAIAARRFAVPPRD